MSKKGGVIGNTKRIFEGPGEPNKNGDPLGPGYYHSESGLLNKDQGISFPKSGNSSKNQKKVIAPGPG